MQVEQKRKAFLVAEVRSIECGDPRNRKKHKSCQTYCALDSLSSTVFSIYFPEGDGTTGQWCGTLGITSWSLFGLRSSWTYALLMI